MNSASVLTKAKSTGSNICLETSVAEALGCCRAINERYLCSEAPFYLGFGVVPIAFMMLAELLLHNKAARS